MRRPALVALAALAACSNKPPPPTIGFHEPTAVAVFSGWTPEKPRQASLPQPYLAVANGRADELRIIDLATQQPLESPGFAYALSIPTHPRPLYLAATSLRDAQPDLLVAAGVGAVVDLVTTWEDGSDPFAGGMGVVQSYDLSGLAGAGSEILSMVATPVPGAPAGTPPVATAQPGLARLIIGFSGGKLLVMDFARGSGGSVVPVAAAPQVKPLGFDPVALAVSPDLFHLYCATPDLITDSTLRQVMGVAEVTMSGDATAPWPVRGLDARAPTTLVAAAILGERTPTRICPPPPATCPLSGPDVFSPPALRVYAALDPAGCGSERPINCGIAVIDPSLGGLAADLAPGGAIVPAQPYRAPLFVPAVPLSLSIALPAASGALQCVDEPYCPAQNYRQPLMQLIANGVRWTPAVAAVGASDGRTYLMDLGRSGPASDVSLLNGAATRVQVVSAYSLTPLQPDGSAAKAGLGLYRQYPPSGESPGLTTDATKLTQAVVITPGFTRGDTWSVVWQGFLPGLVAKDFVLGLEVDGSLYLAFQTAMGNQWDVGAYVGNPELAIHAADASPPGDLVQFTLPVDQFGAGGNPCALATGTKYEAGIASILPVAANHPGGALKLVLPSSPTSDPFSILCLQSWLASHTSSPPLAGTDGGVRASGLVLSGAATGYVGRPQMLTEADVNGGATAIANKRFNFAWQDETALTGETLAVTRKARRFFYANDDFFGAGGGAYPETGGDPLKAGPVLGLIVGPMCSDQPPGSGLQAICPDNRLSPPPPPSGDLLRDSSLVFTTIGGVSPSYRSPAPSSLPSSSLAFDRSQFPDDTFGSVFYVTYRQDAVLVAVPGQTLNISGTLR